MFFKRQRSIFVNDQNNVVKAIAKYTLAAYFIFIGLSINAQINPAFQSVLVQDGQTNNEILIKSIAVAPDVLAPSAGSGYDTLHLEPHGSLNDTWILSFTPKSGEEGQQEFAIEYSDFGSIPGMLVKRYTEVGFEVRPSVVRADYDFGVLSGNSALFAVLDNDNGSNITLDAISFVSNGSAVITGNQIDFTVDDSSKRSFVQYITKDDNGVANHAVLCIVSENGNPSNVSRSMHNKSSIDLLLDRTDYVLVNGPSNGSVSQINGVSWSYTPNSNYVGTDLIEFEDANGNPSSFDVTVYNKQINTSFIRDDEIYTPIQTSVSFDVFQNDLKTDFGIFDYSSELTYLGNGQFEYLPGPSVEGDQLFYYRIFTGTSFVTGDIIVHVDDQLPIDTLNHSFDILLDEHLELNYQPGFESFVWTLPTNPSNGSVTILDSNGNVTTACESIQGNNKIIYTPNSGFSGNDEFDIEYCTDFDQCAILKINVNVSSIAAANCACYNDCVWPGDTNADGIVNLKDYMISYLYAGNAGDSRTNTSSNWEAQKCSDWNFNMAGTAVDQKNADCDGDGDVDQDDVQIVNDHYGKVNDLIGDQVFNLSDLPISIVPTQTQVDSGEWAFLNIVLGTSNLPALDFHGLGLHLDFDAGLMDSASVSLVTYNDSWAGQSGPINSMVSVPQDGKIEIGISELSNIGPSGEGIIGQLGFIVEDDLNGWRLDDGTITMKIQSTNNFMMNVEGMIFQLPDAEAQFEIIKHPESQASLDQFIDVFPNPANQFVNLQSEKYSIDRVEAYDIAGRFISTQQFYNQHTVKFNTQSFDDGMYLLKIFTHDQAVVKKLQVFNH